MYIPKFFKVTDYNEIIDFIQKNSFGIIVTTMENKPIATHVPLELHKKGDDYYITGHLAINNPQWKTFDNENKVLIIYQGPHSYISASWYNHENVSTWNYQAVHVYGSAYIMTEEELEEDLKLLLEKYEVHRENPVLWEKLSPQTKKLMKGIVGFKVKVEEIQAAYKLSQNRNEEDYLSIVKNLQLENDPNSQKMAEIMEKRI